VHRIDLDEAQRFLVSASDDKTARVWDLRNGSLLKILRPPISDFEEGKLYAVAISPDGKTVAVGGFTSASSVKETPIYIFDRESGTIVRTIPTVLQPTNHLAYSKDGRYLAAALQRKSGIHVFETVGYSEVAHDADYGDASFWIEFDKSGRLITASYDGFVRLYNSDFHLLKKQKTPDGRQPASTRFSPDGRLIAVGFADAATVDILSASDLSFQFGVQPPTADINAALDMNLHVGLWSADGRTLCGAGTFNAGSVMPLLCWANAGKGTLTTLPISGGTVMDIRALRDGGIAFADVYGTVGVLGPDGKVQWRAASEIPVYAEGLALPRISRNGDEIESSAYYFNGTEWGSHTLRYSVTDRKLEIDTQPDSSLSSPVTDGLGLAGWRDTFAPTIDGHALELKSHEQSRSVAIAAKQESFVLGAQWSIYRFDRQGKHVWDTPSSTVIGVNVTLDQHFVVATLSDGTVRWYTFDKGEEVLALFVDRDLKRWVAWNPDGFFAFEGGGDGLIGYQINRGPGQAGDFVKVDQLRDVFYRPDLIAQILEPGGAKAVVAARNRIGDISKVLSSGLPPEINLLSVAPTDEAEKYLVQFQVKDMGGGRGRIVYRIDGIEIEARDAVDIKGTGSNTISRYITVGSGQHTLSIAGRSANDKIEGTPRTAHLLGRQSVPGSRTALYVIAAGISHYSDHSLDEGVKFAARDADLVAARFHQQRWPVIKQP
jgi:WD40 repeat protein